MAEIPFFLLRKLIFFQSVFSPKSAICILIISCVPPPPTAPSFFEGHIFPICAHLERCLIYYFEIATVLVAKWFEILPPWSSHCDPLMPEAAPRNIALYFYIFFGQIIPGCACKQDFFQTPAPTCPKERGAGVIDRFSTWIKPRSSVILFSVKNLISRNSSMSKL